MWESELVTWEVMWESKIVTLDVMWESKLEVLTGFRNFGFSVFFLRSHPTDFFGWRNSATQSKNIQEWLFC